MSGPAEFHTVGAAPVSVWDWVWFGIALAWECGLLVAYWVCVSWVSFLVSVFWFCSLTLVLGLVWFVLAWFVLV